VARTDEAIEKIKQMIFSGELHPGQKLPVEKDLSVQLGLSRSSLREAVRALTLAGVLKARQGDGTYVTSLEPDLLLETMGLAVAFMRSHTLTELFEVRRLLEPAATALAAARMEPEELSRLEECLRRMESAVNVEELVEADDEFHSIIAGATRNGALAALLRNFSGRTLRARIWRGMAGRDALESTKVWHHTIYRAIADRDPELARSAAAMHVAEVESWSREQLEAGEDPASVNGV
jgi:GntR family transcriptional repressor for pyruvate dehydrogenase complex